MSYIYNEDFSKILDELGDIMVRIGEVHKSKQYLRARDSIYSYPENITNVSQIKLLPGDNLKLPHMGWNELNIKSLGHPVFKNVDQGAFFYFVHSFHMQLKEEKFVLATTDYGDSIAAVVGKDNMIGTQFHPEKSQKTGLLMLENFLNWRP